MKILAHISVNIILLIIYSYFFGQKSIQKFLKRGVVIVQQEDGNSSIIHVQVTHIHTIHMYITYLRKSLNDAFVVITIIPMNATSGTGWKNEDDTACMDFKGNQFIECIERHAYSKEELHLESNKNVKFRQIFVVNLTAILQSLEIRQGDITSKAKSAMEIKLNHNLNYFVYITDPALEFFFDSPSIIPRIMLSLKDQTGLLLHLEVPCYYILYTKDL